MRGVVFRVGQGVWRSLVPLSIQQRRGRAAEDKRILNGDIDTHRAIFVHIPKAAGSAVGVALYGHDRPGHFPITRYQGLLGNAINDYLTFTFVRHPEDRFISAYNYLLDKPKNPSDVDFAHNVLKRFQSIDEFIANYLTEKTLFSHVHFYPQTHFIQSDGNLNIDFIGRYENLQEDFGKLCAILNLDARLEQMNVTKEKAASNLSAPSQDKLRFLYRNDYEFLGYE
jgi:hypothetical protein